MSGECKGCHLYYGKKGNPSKCLVRALPYVDVDECPCRICLVKGICNDTCEDFSEYLKGKRGKYNV